MNENKTKDRFGLMTRKKSNGFLPRKSRMEKTVG
jgi:hypothetical protein